MKKCKYCQTEIDQKAKVCPNCHKKQSHIFRWIILGVLVVAVIGAVLGGKDKKDFKKDYNQNDVVTYNDVVYSILKVERTKGSNEFIQPKKGYEYVKVTIKIENKSKEKISYNALDFQMVNGDGQEDAWGTYTADNDVTLSTGELDSDGKVEGVLVWEQKVGDNALKVRYYDNVLFDKDYTFQWSLN